jgi:hypothetical protein
LGDPNNFQLELRRQNFQFCGWQFTKTSERTILFRRGIFIPHFILRCIYLLFLCLTKKIWINKHKNDFTGLILATEIAIWRRIIWSSCKGTDFFFLAKNFTCTFSRKLLSICTYFVKERKSEGKERKGRKRNGGNGIATMRTCATAPKSCTNELSF